MARSPRSRRSSAFSLLEVMVALSILGLVMTVILSAQAGLTASNRTAGRMGVAAELARCKMTEQEEKLIKFGYSEIDQVDTDQACCEDVETPDYKCDVRVEKVELPPAQTTGGGGDGGKLDLGGAGGLGAAAAAAGSALAAPGVVAGLNPGGGAGLNLDIDAGLQGIGNLASQQFGVGGAGAGGLVSMVMAMVYPSLKSTLEASIRRVTITIKWHEGSRPRDLTLMQYVTNPQRGNLLSDVLPGVLGGNPPGGNPPGGNTPGTSGGGAGK